MSPPGFATIKKAGSPRRLLTAFAGALFLACSASADPRLCGEWELVSFRDVIQGVLLPGAIVVGGIPLDKQALEINRDAARRLFIPETGRMTFECADPASGTSGRVRSEQVRSGTGPWSDGGGFQPLRDLFPNRVEHPELYTYLNARERNYSGTFSVTQANTLVDVVDPAGSNWAALNGKEIPHSFRMSGDDELITINSSGNSQWEYTWRRVAGSGGSGAPVGGWGVMPRLPQQLSLSGAGATMAGSFEWPWETRASA